MTRFHELDALRASAMLLGIVLHACLFLLPFWMVKDAYVYSRGVDSNPCLYLVMGIHGFRMPLFFLLSGFFTALLWQRRGLGQLIKHRLQRIGVPLLAGAYTIVPLIFWMEMQMDFRPSFWLLVPFWENGLAHLWFLWSPLLLGTLFVGLVKMGIKFDVPGVRWWLMPLAALPAGLMTKGSFGPDTLGSTACSPADPGFLCRLFSLWNLLLPAEIADPKAVDRLAVPSSHHSLALRSGHGQR